MKPITPNNKPAINQGQTKQFLFEMDDDTPVNNYNSIPNKVQDLPKGNFDWTAWLQPPRNQGQCGCCWAFSTAGAIEGANNIKNGAVSADYLSPQQLVDCDVGNVDNGCNGGWPGLAMDYIINNGGIETESNYPYQGQQGTCNYQNQSNNVKISSKSLCGDQNTPPCDTTTWFGLLQQGPISVTINAGIPAFQNYAGGILDPTQMGCTQIDHAIVAVGWDSNNVINVRNSWGPTWGENGYFRIQYTAQGNTCFITQTAFKPNI